MPGRAAKNARARCKNRITVVAHSPVSFSVQTQREDPSTAKRW